MTITFIDEAIFVSPEIQAAAYQLIMTRKAVPEKAPTKVVSSKKHYHVFTKPYARKS